MVNKINNFSMGKKIYICQIHLVIMDDEVRGLEKLKFIYVGERSFWKYKSSGWGVIIPSIDSEHLGISKQSVARLFVSYDKRVVLIKIVDTHIHDEGIEEEVLNLLHSRNVKKEDVDRVIEKLKKIANEKEEKKNPPKKNKKTKTVKKTTRKKSAERKAEI